MNAGNSYAKATSEAFLHIYLLKNIDMSQPNNILGFQYIKAILMQNSSMQAQTIKDSHLIIMMKHLTTNILQAQQVFANNFLVKIVPLQKLSLSSQKRLLLF